MPLNGIRFFLLAKIFPFACINQLCVRERTSAEIVQVFFFFGSDVAAQCDQI